MTRPQTALVADIVDDLLTSAVGWVGGAVPVLARLEATL
jgi:hypothetical protein